MKWIVGFFAAIGLAGVIQAKAPHWWTEGLAINQRIIPWAWFCFAALLIAVYKIGKGK